PSGAHHWEATNLVVHPPSLPGPSLAVMVLAPLLPWLAVVAAPGCRCPQCSSEWPPSCPLAPAFVAGHTHPLASCRIRWWVDALPPLSYTYRRRLLPAPNPPSPTANSLSEPGEHLWASYRAIRSVLFAPRRPIRSCADRLLRRHSTPISPQVLHKAWENTP